MGNDYKFTGKEWDDESGLHYFWHRFFDPEIGGGIQVEPMWMKYPSLTPYQYCPIRDSCWSVNNPLTFIDPDGKQTLQISLMGTAGCGAGGTIGSGIALGRDGIKPFSQYGGGSFIGSSASETIEITMSLNRSTSQLNGLVMSNGGSLSFGPFTFGAEINTPVDGSGAKGSLTLSFGLSTPSLTVVSGEGHSFLQKTTILDLNSGIINISLGNQSGSAPAEVLSYS